MGSHYWGFEVHGVIPDIVVMGKGISNGFPLSAVVMKRAIAELMTEKRFFNTYGANPVACAAGRAVLRIIDEEELQENANRVGEQMLNGLQQLQAKYDIIGDVRGRGLMIGVELVKDRATKKPATAETGRVFEVTKNVGLIMGRSRSQECSSDKPSPLHPVRRCQVLSRRYGFEPRKFVNVSVC